MPLDLTLTDIVDWFSKIMMSFEAAERMLSMALIVVFAVKSVKRPTDFRNSHPWIAALLPLGFLLTAIAWGFAANPFPTRFVFDRDPDLLADARRDLEKLGLELQGSGAFNSGLANTDDLSDF